MSKPTNQVPTRYSDNQNDSNSVIDLIFFQQNSSELDNHTVHPEWRLLSDHAPLTVNIVIFEKHIQTKKHTIIKNSKEKKNFLAELIESFKGLNIEHISSKKALKQTIQEFTNNTDRVYNVIKKIVMNGMMQKRRVPTIISNVKIPFYN